MKYEWSGMQFDWDEEKSAINLAKHGRAFLDSHLVWLQPHGQLLAGNTETEERLVRRGIIENQVWLCVYTMRGDKYRVMSLRPAHKKEKEMP